MNNVRPPEIDSALFNRGKTGEARIKHLLKYAILSPSTHNTQPWRFKLSNDSCQIYIDKHRQLPAADQLKRDMYISLGALIENLEQATRAYGVAANTVISDQNSDLVATVNFKGIQSDKHIINEVILAAIRQRTNYRGPFDPVKTDELDKSLAAQLRPGIRIKFITDRPVIDRIAVLTSRGLEQAYATPQFRSEISSWINNNLSRKPHGIPGYSLRLPLVLSFIIPKLMKRINMGKKLAALNHKSFVQASAVAVLTATDPSPKTWLEVGRSFERMSLTLVQQGLASSIFVAAVESPKLSIKLSETLGLTGQEQPQFLFVIGKPVLPLVYSPRETVESKLIH